MVKYAWVCPHISSQARRKRNALLTTRTEEHAMAAAAKTGACARKKGISGDSMARGMRSTL